MLSFKSSGRLANSKKETIKEIPCHPREINPWKPLHHPEKFFSRGAGLCSLFLPSAIQQNPKRSRKGLKCGGLFC